MDYWTAFAPAGQRDGYEYNRKFSAYTKIDAIRQKWTEIYSKKWVKLVISTIALSIRLIICIFWNQL